VEKAGDDEDEDDDDEEEEEEEEEEEPEVFPCEWGRTEGRPKGRGGGVEFACEWWCGCCCCCWCDCVCWFIPPITVATEEGLFTALPFQVFAVINLRFFMILGDVDPAGCCCEDDVDAADEDGLEVLWWLVEVVWWEVAVVWWGVAVEVAVLGAVVVALFHCCCCCSCCCCAGLKGGGGSSSGTPVGRRSEETWRVRREGDEPEDDEEDETEAFAFEGEAEEWAWNRKGGCIANPSFSPPPPVVPFKLIAFLLPTTWSTIS